MIESCYILGTQVSLVQIPDAIAEMERWIADARGRGPVRCAVLTNVNCVMSARRDAAYRRVLNAADLAVPDGMPLVWVARRRGHDHMFRRVYGPELLLAFCERAVERDYRFYLYGGAEGVAQRVAEVLRARFPKLQIVGAETPPFRPLTPEEDASVCERINAAAPDVLWVALGAPKQDLWMAEHASRLRVPALVGIGAAFDFFAGRVCQAPHWMRESGLEWSFRLIVDPRRLWFRYLVYNPWFLWSLLLEACGLKTFPRD